MADLFEEKNISPMLLNEVKEPFDDDNYISIKKRLYASSSSG